MKESPCSIYDPARFDKDAPANVRGGKARADTACRDSFGRFMPKIGELPAPECHGVAGGKQRVIKAKRDNRGRFIK